MDELDYGLLLMAHLICADGQIHIQEAKALKSLSDEINSGKATRTALEAILTKSSEAPAVYALAEKVLPGQQTEVLKQLLAIAYIDGYLAPEEASFIKHTAKLWNISENDAERLRLIHAQPQSGFDIAEDELSTGAKILKGAESVLSRALVKRFTDAAPKSLGHHVRKFQQELLLAGPEYDEAIARCAKVAREDYDSANHKLKQASRSLKFLREDLQKVLDRLSSRISKGNGSKTLGDVVNQLEATRQVLDDKTLQELRHIQTTLKAKHRSLNHFTIAFMGRTKAGKSTLHATITGEGWEGIGVGEQRTTRYNQTYEWKNIRIIDTPGIGAPGGESDETIAKSVIDESDVICYVVTDDSIQATEFEFMKVLRDRTKPLIILLNMKKNLQDSRRLEHFLSNPDKLFRQGENGTDGHINRIRRYAEEHYANGYVDVVPVMLLAAQIARQAKDKKQTSRLLEASRINDFLDSLRMAIIDYGPIRRSQTLIGSTVGSVEEPLDWIRVQADIYYQKAQVIASQRDRLKKDFKEALADTQSDLNIKVQTVFSDLSQSVDAFAIEHWESPAEDLQKAWKAKLKQYQLNSRLETAVKEAQSELESRTQETLEEIGTELELLASFSTGSVKFSKLNHSFFEKHKGLIALGSVVIGALALVPPLAPFAFVLGGVGTALGFLAGMLKSKSKRQSEAVSQIRTQLLAQLNANEKKFLEQTRKQTKQCSETITTSVDDYFKQLSDGLEHMADCLQDAEMSLSKIAASLNKDYASRILEWATDGQAQKVSRVKRDFGEEIQIWPSSDYTEAFLQKSTEELSQILQETIVIH